MKNKIIYITLTAIIGIGCFFSGQKSVEIQTAPESKCIIENQRNMLKDIVDQIIMFENPVYLDMSTVIDFVATEEGLQLYTSDGNGYYLER